MVRSSSSSTYFKIPDSSRDGDDDDDDDESEGLKCELTALVSAYAPGTEVRAGVRGKLVLGLGVV